MENDVTRLNRIAMAIFKKIGSRPDSRRNVSPTRFRNPSIFQQAARRTGMKVRHHSSSAYPLMYTYNAELFEWVLENLMKNGLNAMAKNRVRLNFFVSKVRQYD